MINLRKMGQKTAEREINNNMLNISKVNLFCFFTIYLYGVVVLLLKNWNDREQPGETRLFNVVVFIHGVV